MRHIHKILYVLFTLPLKKTSIRFPRPTIRITPPNWFDLDFLYLCTQKLHVPYILHTYLTYRRWWILGWHCNSEIWNWGRKYNLKLVLDLILRNIKMNFLYLKKFSLKVAPLSLYNTRIVNEMHIWLDLD